MTDRRYNYQNFGELFSYSYYTRLMQEQGAIGFLEHELRIINGYKKFAADFPDIMCEPLDFLYQCSKSVSNFNDQILEDFLNFSWRGIVWSSRVTLITPNDTDYFYPRLKSLKGVHEKMNG